MTTLNALCLGKCSEHSEILPVSVNHNGHIKPDYEDLNFHLDNKFNELQAYLERQNLKEHRKNGECFAATYDGTFFEGTEINSRYWALLNPSSNTKTLYVYNIRNSCAVASSGVTIRHSIGTIPESQILASDGTIIDNATKNLKTGSLNTSNCVFYADISTDLSNVNVIEKIRFFERNDPFFNLDFQEEYIEVPPGYALFLRMIKNTITSISMDFNIRYIETTDEL